MRTVSGIRGTIKKAAAPGGILKLREGTVRVTFEDKILMWVKLPHASQAGTALPL